MNIDNTDIVSTLHAYYDALESWRRSSSGQFGFENYHNMSRMYWYVRNRVDTGLDEVVIEQLERVLDGGRGLGKRRSIKLGKK